VDGAPPPKQVIDAWLDLVDARMLLILLMFRNAKKPSLGCCIGFEDFNLLEYIALLD
jgi:hypothetical protein